MPDLQFSLASAITVDKQRYSITPVHAVADSFLTFRTALPAMRSPSIVKKLDKE